jgi:hypothetical protein
VAPVPRYFVDLPDAAGPLPWDPHAGPRPERADTRYFGAVFQAMEARLDDADIDVLLTWDAARLPWYGERVVAVVLGDEGSRIPRYTASVRAVFKAYGIRPALGAGPLRDPSPAGLANLAQWGLRWLRWLPGGTAHAGVIVARRLRRRPPPPAVTVIPLGTYNQIDLPVVPMDDRATDVFFAGSVEHVASLRHRLASPKTRARREMLAALGRLARRRPALRLDVRLTPGFDASAAASPLAYSRALVDARVCLAPRGTSLETFRVFEGLRAGCVVVADRLPRHWFYHGGPVIQLDRWYQLDRALEPLLDSPSELHERQAAGLAWWRERCSEAAVGRVMAERLNALGDRNPRAGTLACPLSRLSP